MSDERNYDINVTGSDDDRDKKFTDIIRSITGNACESDNDVVSSADNASSLPPLLFGIDLRGGAIRREMNGAHETAPSLERAEGLVIRLMGSMMARFTAMENAHADNIRRVDANMLDVIVIIDDIGPLSDSKNIVRGIRCLRRIGGQAGYHVIIGGRDMDSVEELLDASNPVKNRTDDLLIAL